MILSWCITEFCLQIGWSQWHWVNASLNSAFWLVDPNDTELMHHWILHSDWLITMILSWCITRFCLLIGWPQWYWVDTTLDSAFWLTDPNNTELMHHWILLLDWLNPTILSWCITKFCLLIGWTQRYWVDASLNSAFWLADSNDAELMHHWLLLSDWLIPMIQNRLCRSNVWTEQVLRWQMLDFSDLDLCFNVKRLLHWIVN